MQEFKTTLIMVGIMLAYAVPGFILIKTKFVKTDSISAFSKLLMFVCQPALTLYSFNKSGFYKATRNKFTYILGYYNCRAVDIYRYILSYIQKKTRRY